MASSLKTRQDVDDEMMKMLEECEHDYQIFQEEEKALEEQIAKDPIHSADLSKPLSSFHMIQLMRLLNERKESFNDPWISEWSAMESGPECAERVRAKLKSVCLHPMYTNHEEIVESASQKGNIILFVRPKMSIFYNKKALAEWYPLPESMLSPSLPNHRLSLSLQKFAIFFRFIPMQPIIYDYV
jgi:hypothetical protein